MGAELEEIVDRASRRGVLGYLRSGNDAWFRRRAPIERPSSDPAAFDLLVIGTPVWRASLASPVLTYLQDYAQRMRRVGFFCTMGRSGAARAFRQMQQLCGKAPAANAGADRTRARHAAARRYRGRIGVKP